MPESQLNFIRKKHGFDMHFTGGGANSLIPIIKKRSCRVLIRPVEVTTKVGRKYSCLMTSFRGHKHYIVLLQLHYKKVILNKSECI